MPAVESGTGDYVAQRSVVPPDVGVEIGMLFGGGGHL